jgi:hypothetical protein
VQAQPHTSFAKVLMCAALAMFVAAPATFADSGPTAPVFPSAVPSHPGALTGTDGASDAARVQERYYSPCSSYAHGAGPAACEWPHSTEECSREPGACRALVRPAGIAVPRGLHVHADGRDRRIA